VNAHPEKPKPIIIDPYFFYLRQSPKVDLLLWITTGVTHNVASTN